VPKTSWRKGTKTSAAAKSSSATMPQSKRGFVRNPTDRSDARSVRAASAVPTWHATMPAKVIVVAAR
jgi:hypothetical protein